MKTFAVQSPGALDFAQQMPRKENGAADAAANRALDSGSFYEVFAPQVSAMVSELSKREAHTVGLLFSFDGAARGNPGPASSGICAWWGKYVKDEFVPHGMLLQRGLQLGSKTNNVSEAHGLATSLKTCLHLHFWVIEQISNLSRRIVRDE